MVSLLCSALAVLTGAALFRMEWHRRRTEALTDLEEHFRRTSAAERHLRALFQGNRDVIAVVRPEGTVVVVNGACEAAWDVSAEQIVGTSIFDRLDPDGSPREADDLARAIAGSGAARVELGMIGSGGERREFEASIVDLTGDPDVGGVLLTFRDLTERKRVEAELEHRAFHDRLTGLPNRALFMNRLTHRLAAQEADESTFAVLFVDLDNFKVVNDSLGHEAGDLLLVEVARRLQESVRATDTVARLGGDEFTLIVDDSPEPPEALGVAERILARMADPILVGDRELYVACSIGIVMADGEETDAARLLRDADTAMYRAKGRGKGRATLFEPTMSLQAAERREFETDLRDALESGGLSLAYQPVVDLTTGRPRGVEALLRWNDPVRGEVAPESFLPVAEETGLVRPIGQWVLREACAHLSAWNDGLAPDERLVVGVNVSAAQLRDADFADEVRSTLEALGMAPSLLELEISEVALLDDFDRAKDDLNRLRALGVRLVLDDCGAGRFSSAFLRDLPLDALKIDRTIVAELGRDEWAKEIVEAIASEAQSSGWEIFGKGIETQEQRRHLRAVGCRWGQGFLFDHPLVPEQVTELLVAEPDGGLRLAA